MLTRWLFTCCFVVLSGLIQAQNAPVTTVPELFNVMPGEVTVPVIVSDFNQIGAISLNLEYDPEVLTFVQGDLNSLISGMFAIGNNLLPSGLRSLAIGWFGDAQSLPEGAVLIDLKFNFLGGTTNLTWFDDGASCEYTDAAYYALNDVPTNCHYVNGLVTSEKCLNLNFILEGLYNPDTHLMGSALGNVSGPCEVGISDYAQVELRSADDYSNIVFATGDFNLNMTGQTRVLVPSALNENYHITVRHRNSIATVSAVPVSFSGTIMNYSFTDQSSKAWGSNMIQMADGKWAFFSGDVNQDGSVDTGDMSPVDNDAAAFASGYLATDVNGDGMVDTADITLIDNNAANFTGSITP